MDSYTIIKALREQYPTKVWATFQELRIGTGYANGRGHSDVEQRIDFWAMCMYPSMGLERIAFEVKVSRSDFKREIAEPIKRRPALLNSNKFYFAAPLGLIKPDEVPTECGLVELDMEGKLHYTIRAPHRDTPPPNFSFLASLARRAATAEEEAYQRIKREAAQEEAKKQKGLAL